jgi:hypothetical protein
MKSLCRQGRVIAVGDKAGDQVGSEGDPGREPIAGSGRNGQPQPRWASAAGS